MGQFLPIFGGICNKLSHEKTRQFSDVTCKKFTHTNGIMWHKNKRKKSGVAVKLLITQNGTVKPNVIAVSGSLIITAVEKNFEIEDPSCQQNSHYCSYHTNSLSPPRHTVSYFLSV